ncbi:Hok/Gef family protein [Yersinia pekkanenii]|uniref:Hok/Gef family protein n=1 Tax=Yersinia pekkanenii TaxID=1288385 RepID=UPI00092D1B8E|nr:Hok/Gef family protein [Yersinia pekkanenii]
MFSKFTLYGLGMVCITILMFTLLVRDSLCEIRVERGDVVLLATLAYEVRK